VRFRYRLSGAESVDVRLVNKDKAKLSSMNLRDLKQDQWAVAQASFAETAPLQGKADEIQFMLPAGAEMLLDDLLLFEPTATK
jgi:hypothetical protein